MADGDSADVAPERAYTVRAIVMNRLNAYALQRVRSWVLYLIQGEDRLDVFIGAAKVVQPVNHKPAYLNQFQRGRVLMRPENGLSQFSALFHQLGKPAKHAYLVARLYNAVSRFVL